MNNFEELETIINSEIQNLTEKQRMELISRLEYVKQHPDEGILWEELMAQLWVNE